MFTKQVGGLLVKDLVSIFGVQGPNYTNDMVMVKNDILTKYFFY
jgi:hypothetical protein